MVEKTIYKHIKNRRFDIMVEINNDELEPLGSVKLKIKKYEFKSR